MISGKYSGTFSNGTGNAPPNMTGLVAGLAVPLTGRGAEIFPHHEAASGGGTQWSGCAGVNGNIVTWYGLKASSGEYFTVGLPSASQSVCPFLTPAEAQAWSGSIIAPNYFGHNTKCTNDLTGGTWQLSDKTVSCHLIFTFFK
jgi:hypothetical protein